MSWTIPLQQATFRGVAFNVINITDTFERVIAEHSYPFVNGADLEDMGLQPRRVQLQAVFFGKGYRIALDNLLSALEKAGEDVLVHPVLGRMPNMICQSASLRHGDDFVNYVALDLTFIEMTPAKPIFVFEHHLLVEIDRLLDELERFVDEVLAIFGEYMYFVAFAHHAKARLLGVWSALMGVYESVMAVFNLDPTKFGMSLGISLPHFQTEVGQAAKGLNEMIGSGLNALAFPKLLVKRHHKNTDSTFTALAVRSRFDEVLRQVSHLKHLPNELVSGKNTSPQRAEKLKMLSNFSADEMKEINVLVHLICCKALTQIGVTLIEENEAELLPTDIEHITQHIRLNIKEAIEVVRTLQQQDVTPEAENIAKQNTGIYTKSYQIIEALRQHAHRITQIAIAAINRKPPLMVRQSEISGTVQQLAHHLYGDYTRSSELLRLNPHLREPNFIQQGELINAYSK